MKCSNTGCPYNGNKYDKNCSITDETTSCCDFKAARKKPSDKAIVEALRILCKQKKQGSLAQSLLNEAANRLEELSLLRIGLKF